MSDDKLKDMFSSIDAKHQARLARMDKHYSGDLDSTFNFRCNAELKSDFNNLCKDNQSSSSSVLKRYMLACLRSGRII
ncbi:hypothetical protein VSVS12_03900 [Vibrio scophthalmi]|uniref:hypothetical protein n=1 Tax=Vibrio scophthalmi TaxID=45658 RepID=UPI0008091CBF|nr:hypothetical protein [Vibrio scophthalmi]ANS87600.1 hypothetical protein VSVS12_03900 [Vibrio scophthalmi]